MTEMEHADILTSTCKSYDVRRTKCSSTSWGRVAMQAGIEPLIALLTKLSCASCCTTAHMRVKLSARWCRAHQPCH